MAVNLIAMFDENAGDLLQKQSGSFPSNHPEKTAGLIRSIATSGIAALVQKVQAENGAEELKEYLAEHQLDGTWLQSLQGSTLPDPSQDKKSSEGEELVSFLFGPNTSTLTEALMVDHSVDKSEADHYLYQTVPLLLDVVGKYISEKSLDAQGIKTVLLRQREFIQNDIPSSVGKIYGWVSDGVTVPDEIEPTGATDQTMLSRLMPWIVLLIAAMGLFYFVEKGCGG